jgi:nucleoside phosphorylase
VLVLAAMPLELYPLLSEAEVDPEDVIENGARTFYVGTLAGMPVVLAMTGVGIGNARETTLAAFEHFRCGFSAALFSGVAGSKYYIGDVMIAERWTLDRGKSWYAADPALVALARQLEAPGAVELQQDVPVGDPACVCPGVDAQTPVHFWHAPKVRVGGDGKSNDSTDGTPTPCVPGGGDVTGCQPCNAPGSTVKDLVDFAAHAPDPVQSLEDNTRPVEQTTESYASQDMETASFGKVATRYGVPFLGIRAASDGKGDPLGLPGFPAQFFAYRQITANNAANTTIALLGLLHR